MNRAEKRRQTKLAKQAARNAKLGKATVNPIGQSTSAIESSLELAVQHHGAGRLDDAESIYRQILRADPQQSIAMHLLGVLAHQAGNNDVAVDLITKALAIKPDYAEAHCNLGAAFQQLGELEEAVTSYRRALAIMPNLADAHYNLGNALNDLGMPDEAVKSYLMAIDIRLDYADAHSNLGNVYRDQGDTDAAMACYRKVIDLNPDFVEAHSNLGTVLQDLGDLDAAVASYQTALAIRPDYAQVHCNLGNALREQGKPEEALACHRRAVALMPEDDFLWAGLAATLDKISFTSGDEELWRDLLQLLGRPSVRPYDVARPIVSAVRHHPEFQHVIELIGAVQADVGLAYRDVDERLSAIPLFLRILGLVPISDLQIERMLTFLRVAMLQETMAGTMDQEVLAFSAALALQCFTNEYVYPETNEETTVVDQLQQRIAALVEQDRDVPRSFLVALGTYRPLLGFPWAKAIGAREWTGNVKDVIERQILEPLQEQDLRLQIARLTPIDDSVSRSVRGQYEENPYPRWIKTDIVNKSGAIGPILRGAPLRLDLADYESPQAPEILVAGCGTGQQALSTASRFTNARVLAVDLSLGSLSYAKRKAIEFGFSNIEFAQADILELGELGESGRTFDLIECIGVLHHLADPLAGWRVLVDLLRPGGLMMIGLYSEVARQDIVTGRTLIAEKGYIATGENMRRCRQDVIAMAEAGDPNMSKICHSKDFFSLSDFRDLLFHVQEHRFTLLQVEAALASLKLNFMGFGLQDADTLTNFKKAHTNNGALTALSSWHEFERENPDTFRAMYQFWCQKP